MFARMLELVVKPEKKPELFKRVKEEILPILNRYEGFVDILAFENEAEPTKAVTITLWHTKANAERYEREFFPKVKQIVEPYLMVPVTVKYFKLETTISNRLLSTVAA